MYVHERTFSGKGSGLEVADVFPPDPRHHQDFEVEVLMEGNRSVSPGGPGSEGILGRGTKEGAPNIVTESFRELERGTGGLEERARASYRGAAGGGERFTLVSGQWGHCRASSRYRFLTDAAVWEDAGPAEDGSGRAGGVRSPHQLD